MLNRGVQNSRSSVAFVCNETFVWFLKLEDSAYNPPYCSLRSCNTLYSQSVSATSPRCEHSGLSEHHAPFLHRFHYDSIVESEELSEFVKN